MSMNQNDLLKKIECSCSICKTTGTVGQKYTDSGDKVWDMFYCAPDENAGPEVKNYTVICLYCLIKNQTMIRLANPDWFKGRVFLPTLLEEMVKNSSGSSTSENIKPRQNSKSGNYLTLYRKKFSPMTVDEREREASHQTKELLMALCHDPDVRVIKRVLENHSSGLEHARLIAKVHKNSQGLEYIIRNSQLMFDNRVQTNLLKNPILSDSQIRTLLNPKTLIQTWNIACSHDYPANNKQRARTIVKEKFKRAAQEERAAFIYDTEGRILIIIHDVPFGDQTIAILCKKSYHSLLLIQNLAKCGRTPAKLLRHLEIQSIVKHNKAVKNLIKRHANYPKAFSRKK
jgi:hypothetical protein